MIMKGEKRMKSKDIIKFNYSNMKKIDTKYDELVTNVVNYIRAELAETDSEEAINDILEIFLGAQERGEDLYEIVGDYKEFCNNVISSYKVDNNYYFIKNFKDSFKVWIFMLGFFISINVLSSIDIKNISVEKLIKSSYSLTPSPVIYSILCIIAADIIMRYVLKKDIKKSSAGKVALRAFFINIFLISIMVVVGLVAKNADILKMPTYLRVMVEAVFMVKNVVIVTIPNYFMVIVAAIIVLAIYIFIAIKKLILE